jgi:hypothetical protein
VGPPVGPSVDPPVLPVGPPGSSGRSSGGPPQDPQVAFQPKIRNRPQRPFPGGVLLKDFEVGPRRRRAAWEASGPALRPCHGSALGSQVELERPLESFRACLVSGDLCGTCIFLCIPTEDATPPPAYQCHCSPVAVLFDVITAWLHGFRITLQ